MGKTRRQAIVIFGIFFLLSTVQVALASGTQRHKWWAADEAKEELKLTDTQVQEIEDIFQRMLHGQHCLGVRQGGVRARGADGSGCEQGVAGS